MKKTKMIMLVLTSAVLALTPVTASAASTNTSQVSASAAKKSAKKQGWEILKSGNKRYYKNGKRVTGFQKLGKNYYYFTNKGILLRNRTITNGYKGFTYYTNKNGRVVVKTKGTGYYNANGTPMSQAQIADFRAKQIASEITNSGMSSSQKLQTCFNWVIRRYYNIWRDFDQGGENWPAAFANDHFLHGNGDCVSDASAFAYLAKAIGYKNVYVCADAVRSNNNAHAWCEINGYVYDPLFAEAKSYSKYYGATYGSYGLYPVLKYKIS